MQSRLICGLGIIILVSIAWLLSSDRRRFPVRIVVGGILLQIVLGFLVLRTPWGQLLFEQLGNGVTHLLSFVDEGASFVFDINARSTDSVDDIIPVKHALLRTFAFGVLPTVIFFSAFMSVLYHIGVMQWVVISMAWAMQRTLGTSGPETLSAAANVFVGHTEAPLVVKPYLATMTRSELNALMTGGFATVTGGLLGAYVDMGMDASHLITASVISAPAALLIAKVMLPETEGAPSTERLQLSSEKASVNVIGAAVQGASDGLKLALNVAAMLIAFLALIALCNSILVAITGVTLESILGYVFAPLALCMGIPIDESVAAGEFIGIKTVANEFIAFMQLGELDTASVDSPISERTKTILTYALAGFSNFGAIGIQVGGIGGLEPSRKDDLAKLGLRAMFGGLLACCMTGAVAGMLL
ncbi:Nucleoside permease NupX [Novipirellula aureliae]|uniref:Nucleoside permease NupX n=1 Tax=Novipirellula aureliae TaxID=2527966 RepID=A0A5C6E0Z8_9BACT|nr:nucleoside transporter C-terminal domain-containing protein [Novipirellula aureliae]TWU43373.1 Nucleoside permease NupX [Novipirellula aureliae]